MSSLFSHVIPKTPRVFTMDDLREKKKKVVELCCKTNGRKLKVYNELHVNEGIRGMPTISNGVQVPSFATLGIEEVASSGRVREEINPKDLDLSDGIGIVRFLGGKVFLITGATGFLAKVLIEKILRTVPDVGKIYLLIKAKDRDAGMERLKKEIIDTDLFQRIRQSHGKSHQAFMLNKLVPVVGNVCESKLGMELGLADHIANEVDIIVNSAGNTTFDERYDVALNTNTLGPCRLLNFAKRCKGLKLFLHVSTAYVNGQRQGVIAEKPLYIGDSIARERAALESPSRSFPRLDVEAEVKMALDARNVFQDNMVTQKMKYMGLERARMYGWQDTYVFTKAMGEMMIENQREDLPVVIIRPSIIESTYKEPIPGWIEGIRMIDPVILMYGKGELTGFPIDAKGIIDTVPADMVVNATLAAMAKHGAVSIPGMKIYQIGSSVINPLVNDDMTRYFFEYFNSSPYMDSRRRPISLQRMKLFQSMNEFDSHIEREAIQRCVNSPKGMNLPRRLQRSLDIAKQLANLYEPYTFYEGRFDNTNTQELMKELSQEERRSFGFDVGSIDWQDYFCNIHIPGLLRHVKKGRGM